MVNERRTNLHIPNDHKLVSTGVPTVTLTLLEVTFWSEVDKGQTKVFFVKSHRCRLDVIEFVVEIYSPCIKSSL